MEKVRFCDLKNDIAPLFQIKLSKPQIDVNLSLMNVLKSDCHYNRLFHFWS